MRSTSAGPRATVRAVWTALRYSWRLFRLTRTSAERVGLVRFGLRYIAAHLGGGDAHTDTCVSLHGTTYTVGLKNMELLGFVETYGDGVYDKSADFIARAGWTVFDVGANVGMFAVQQARRGAHVYAFEPNPDCRRRLVRTLTENDLTNAVCVLAYALGDSAGSGSMQVPGGRTMSGRVVLGAGDHAGASTVAISSLDIIMPSLGLDHVDLLKIDTEGAEMAVLQGAVHILGTVDRIIVEYHSSRLRDEVATLLRLQGFALTLHLPTAPEVGIGMLYATR